ncbi:MAG: isopentenyl-diphosphate delta-isomerase type 1 [Urechidicola sp.]|jgi:isopentenyl-diphosphate delta-isomerase type 1
MSAIEVSQELLDVVDENDQVVAVKTRGEIHAKGLLHRAVHILVFNQKGDLFIQKRSMSKDECPGFWDTSAAGHVDSGEDYVNCAIRELYEELGITVKLPLEFLFKLKPEMSSGMEHTTVFSYVDEGPFQLQKEEIDEGNWISKKEMDQRVGSADPTLTQVVSKIWRQFRQSK